MQRLTWASLASPVVHVARWTHGRDQGSGLHDHDFAELFWLEAGGCRHEVNDRVLDLGPGDLTWMRPADTHRLRPGPGHGTFTFVNIALPWPAVQALAERYPAVAAAWCEAEELPRQHWLAAESRAELARDLPRIAAPGVDELVRDAFLLRLLSLLDDVGAADAAAAPWLRAALAVLDAPNGLQAGLAAVVAESGRSLDHVNRNVRAAYGCTATELVLARRLDAAARALALGDDDILNIALDVGFNNLGYFYRRFKKRFGCTPRAYRLRRRATQA